MHAVVVSGNIQNWFQVYLFYNKCMMMFEVIDSHDQGYVLQLQGNFCAVGGPVGLPGNAGEQLVGLQAAQRRAFVGEALQ